MIPTPSARALKQFDSTLRKRGDSLYHDILMQSASQCDSVLENGGLLSGFVTEKDYVGLYRTADSLVGQSYPTAAKHFAANQFASIVRKYPWPKEQIPFDPERLAREKFHEAELRCLEANSRLRALRRSWNADAELFSRCRAFVRYVLSDAPDLDSIMQRCDFTGGANIGVHGNATNLARKLSRSKWTCTPTALPYLTYALRRNYHYSEKFAAKNGNFRSVFASLSEVTAHCELVQTNKIAFVPKTAKISRSIAVEPLGNGFLQKGIDLFMRDRLRRIGIDLSDQSPNQAFAREGSLLDSPEGYATLDLSAASDSISIEVCREFLPPDWFDLLNSIRCPAYLLDGKVHRYEKFVSMGNGFCFPLETLLFTAVCHACNCGKPGRDFRVYGDDIVVRKKYFSDVVALLTTLGFSVNKDKTFVDGPFRESCGADWYMGEDVRPFTLDFRLDSLQNIFKFANLSRRNARTTAFFGDMLPRIIESIPYRFRFIRPFAGAADTGIDPLDVEFTFPPWGYSRSYQCWRWFEIATRSVSDRINPEPWVVMAAALRSSEDRQFTLRRMTKTRVRVVTRSGPTGSTLGNDVLP